MCKKNIFGLKSVENVIYMLFLLYLCIFVSILHTRMRNLSFRLKLDKNTKHKVILTPNSAKNAKNGTNMDIFNKNDCIADTQKAILRNFKVHFDKKWKSINIFLNSVIKYTTVPKVICLQSFLMKLCILCFFFFLLVCI